MISISLHKAGILDFEVCGKPMILPLGISALLDLSANFFFLVFIISHNQKTNKSWK